MGWYSRNQRGQVLFPDRESRTDCPHGGSVGADHRCSAGGTNHEGDSTPNGGLKPAALVKRLKTAVHAKVWPAYRRVHVDVDGRLWMEEYSVRAVAVQSWTVFDSSSHLIGRLVLPTPREGEMPLQVIGFGHNEILTRRFDAERATYLAIYRLVPTGLSRR